MPQILCYSIFASATVVLFASCGESNFSGDGSQGPKAQREENARQVDDAHPDRDDSTPNKNSDDVRAPQTPPEDSLDQPTTPPFDGGLAKCAGLIAIDGADVELIRISQVGQEITLNANSVVYIDVTGHAEVNLAAADVKSIKGLCIEAKGGSSVSIETDLVIGGMYYFGRGNAQSEIAFIGDGTLFNVKTDISGSHSLKISGPSIDCQSLDLRSKGSSEIACVSGS